MAQLTREEALDLLHIKGDLAGSDFNDGLDPHGGFYGWSIDEDEVLTVYCVLMDDSGGEGSEHSYAWKLVEIDG